MRLSNQNIKKTVETLKASVRWICWGCAPEMGYGRRSGMTFTIGRCDGPCGERGMVARPEQYTKLPPAGTMMLPVKVAA